MGQMASYLLGGFAAVASWTMVAPSDSPTPTLTDIFRSPVNTSSAGPVVRSTKSDRLVPASPQGTLPDSGVRKTVASIEVVGVDDAAIVYRDREGNVLYRTDPVRNVTVIAKGVKLPEVTVRQTEQTSIRKIPVTIPDAKAPSPMPIGCEPAASPIASPDLARVTGRCVSQAETTVRLAQQ